MSPPDSSSLSLSSLPPPCLRTTPFSVLPPELTQLIIEHTIPPTFQTSTYSSRQSTLRSLCLVSKSFLHFARPLLLATLRFESSNNYKRWKEIHTKGDDKLLCRELICDYSQEKFTLNLDLAGYVGLRTLVLFEAVLDLDISILNHLPQLSVLRLSYIDLSVSTPFSLPNLQELSLFQLDSISDQARFLNPSSLPSLRLLAYYNEDGLLPGIEQFFSTLLPQLHIVSLDYTSIPMLNPDLLRKLDSITLFDAQIRNVEETILVSHIRLETYFRQEDLGNLRDILLRTQLSLPLTLYLPLSASPSGPVGNGDATTRLELFETCTRKGIEVVYEDSSDEWFLNSGFSEHFIEKMKKERAKKRRE